jgi:hypothetical protein
MDRTNAERQRRYIAKLKAKAGTGGVSNAETVAALDRATELLAVAEARIRELEKELAVAQKGGQGEYILSLERENSALRGQLERERKPAKPKAEKPPLPPDEVRDRQIKSLKTRVQNLTYELSAEREWHIQKADGRMSFQTMSLIAKVLHPDTRKQVTEAQTDEACKAFTAWKADKDGAKRRGR